MQYWMLTFVVCVLFIPSSISLKCHVCNSNQNSNCADADRLADFARECTETVEPYCRKIVQTVDKTSSIIRSCGSKSGTKACYKTAGTNNANVCSCDEDLCNNAIDFHGQHRMMTLISSITVLIITMILVR